MAGNWGDRFVAWWSKRGRIVAWLTVSLTLFPPLIAIVALTRYLSTEAGTTPPSGGGSFVVSVLLGLVLAFIVGAFSLIFQTPKRANRYEFRELTNRIKELKTELDQVDATGASTTEARAYAPCECSMFSDRGLRWVAGHGYLTLWTQIHHAEEALFMVEELDWLVAAANYDLLRLKGSSMRQADAFTADIHAAVSALSPCAEQLYLSPTLARDRLAADPNLWEKLARRKLREVRNGINDYRQSLWDGLVLARNQFLRTLIATTVITSIVVDVIVVRGTDERMVLVATVLYLIGVLVGLFARLQGLIGAKSVEEDFGLDTTHLLAAPILSGVAAVVGVVLVGLLKLKIGDVDIGWPPIGPNESALKAIFNLGRNPGALIIAALFGLTPELLIRYLKSQADTFANGLASSETWDKSVPSAGAS